MAGVAAVRVVSAAAARTMAAVTAMTAMLCKPDRVVLPERAEERGGALSVISFRGGIEDLCGKRLAGPKASSNQRCNEK